MEPAQESLAGRVAILHMTSLSQHEIYGSGDTQPFSVDLAQLKTRKKTNSAADMKEIYERIWKGSMPGLASGRFSDRDVFYNSYLQTYIERDVSELIERGQNHVRGFRQSCCLPFGADAEYTRYRYGCWCFR